jgi:hypothetical protein
MEWYWFLLIIVLCFIVATAMFFGMLLILGVLIIRGKLQDGYIRLKVSDSTWQILNTVADEDKLVATYDAIDKQGTLFDLTPKQLAQLLSHLKTRYNKFKTGNSLSRNREYINAIKELTEQMPQQSSSDNAQSKSGGDNGIA